MWVGFFLLQHFEQRVEEAEGGPRVHAFGVEARRLAEGKVGPVDEGHGVEQE
jgi:hypothetical protein